MGVRLEAVTIARAGRVVLGDVTVRLGAGEVARVVGGNGSGKSSLLRVIAGVADPSQGRVVREAPGCAFVPERVALVPRLSPLAWWKAMDGLRGCRREWPALAASWELEDGALSRPAAHLSKGRLQRVALCEAVTAPVGLLVLDEPWAGLDRPGRDALARAVAARAGEGCAVAIADHAGRTRVPTDATWRVAGGGVSPA